MNVAIISAIIGAVFLFVKLAIKYKDPNPKQCIQDAVIVFACSMAGLYGYEKYAGIKQIGPKIASVFTEPPAF